jgi:uncharacterized membrane protein
VPEDAVINLAMPIEDAFKVVISGGIVSPEAARVASLPASKQRPLDPFLDKNRQAIALDEDLWDG